MCAERLQNQFKETETSEQSRKWTTSRESQCGVSAANIHKLQHCPTPDLYLGPGHVTTALTLTDPPKKPNVTNLSVLIELTFVCFSVQFINICKFMYVKWKNKCTSYVCLMPEQQSLVQLTEYNILKVHKLKTNKTKTP